MASSRLDLSRLFQALDEDPQLSLAYEFLQENSILSKTPLLLISDLMSVLVPVYVHCVPPAPVLDPTSASEPVSFLLF